MKSLSQKVCNNCDKKRVKSRNFWSINPKTKVKQSGKLYKRKSLSKILLEERKIDNNA